MSLPFVKDIPKLIEKFGDGEYRIKVKNGRVIIFSKTKRYENNEMKKIIKEIEDI